MPQECREGDEGLCCPRPVPECRVASTTVVDLLAGVVSTDTLCTLLPIASYNMLLALVLHVIVAFDFVWCHWFCCGCCLLLFSCIVTIGYSVLAVGLMFCFPLPPPMAPTKKDAA